GHYKYVMLVGTEKGGGNVYNFTNWTSAIGYGGDITYRALNLKKIVTSRNYSLQNDDSRLKTPAIWARFNNKQVRFFEPSPTGYDARGIHDSIVKYSNAAVLLFNLPGLTSSQIEDSMYSPFGVDTTNNIYRILVGETDTTTANRFVMTPVPGAANGLSDPGNTLRVYPTLVTGMVTVTSGVALRRVDVFSVTGQHWPVTPAAGGDAYNWHVFMDKLPGGVYILKVTDTRGGTFTTKVIKL
ncbi:MAG TPA: T9SS type A sorting domain-containing protein, partial [Puia sp.]|nr:T9SS type A sorting domain-containing protein [Puia sp.]